MNQLDLHSDATISALFQAWASAGRWLLGYSGGLDSTVLLNLCTRAQRLLRDAQLPAPQLQAVHVDHQLSPNHKHWVTHCEEQCRALSVPLIIKTSDVISQGEGLEAAAREARYGIFQNLLQQQDDVLMLGHHQDDQGETLLYRLMRGCGVHGAAAIPAQRALEQGLLARPLLNLPREQIQRYASSYGLAFIEDESNVDLQFDRNFLRQEVLPLLRQRWPSANRTLARFAGLAKEQQQLAHDMAGVDYAAVSTKDARFGQCLAIDKTLALPSHRRNNLYHFLLNALGIETSARVKITEIDAFAHSASAGKQLDAGHYSLRIHQGRLFFIDAQALTGLPRIRQPRGWQFEQHTDGVAGEIQLVETGSDVHPTPQGIRRQRYLLGQRMPNAVARVNGNGKSLKKLLQELGIPAWLRDLVPVLYADIDNASSAPNYQVAAIPGYLVCDDYKDAQGPRLEWQCKDANALESADLA
ncbi:MAG: tRNA lysidine(34) synthetase TilS [Gammaproteobacteria bacterium]|nr:tRNA lysidine(34) synthetase TilS [Gammaproteobacteria bacterium]NNM12153.1 tRNA lysidine(34) synthetase TilS [Pseudomonadales bacterium]